MKTHLTQFIKLLTLEDVDQAARFSKEGLAIFYKHSSICGLSDLAIRQVELFAKDLQEGVKLYFVDVIGSRKVSQQIEAITGIIHESPQVLFVRHGKCFWHASHRKITVEVLNAALVVARDGVNDAPA